MRQVDNFAVSAPSQTLAEVIISSINDKMTVKIKSLGAITRFNGVDITHTSNFIRVYAKTYIKKIPKDKNWLHVTMPGQHLPHYIPIHNATEYNKEIETATPTPDTELKATEK